jgi:hypothetical protein
MYIISRIGGRSSCRKKRKERYGLAPGFSFGQGEEALAGEMHNLM